MSMMILDEQPLTSHQRTSILLSPDQIIVEEQKLTERNLISYDTPNKEGPQAFELIMGNRGHEFQQLKIFQKRLESSYTLHDEESSQISHNDDSVAADMPMELEDLHSQHVPIHNQIVKELNEEEKEQLQLAAKEDGEDVKDQLEEKHHEFDKELVEFNSKFEQQIETHINSNAFTDRRIVGSVVGMSIFGGVGFLVFSGTVTFGISGGVLGIVLGGVIGSRIKRKIDLKKLSVDQFLAFKITQIIKWTNKNQKKLDQLWYAILIEKIIMDTKVLFDYADKKPAQKTLALVRKFLTQKRSLQMLEPHIPSIEEFLTFDEIEQKKTIYKAFNFYIPFLQLIKLSKAFSKYKNLAIYKKLVTIVYSQELIISIIRAVTQTQQNQKFSQELDHESVIYLPQDNEILEIIKQGVNQRTYEPFALFEKRVIQSILIEKLVEEQRLDQMERNLMAAEQNNHEQMQFDLQFQQQNQMKSMLNNNNSMMMGASGSEFNQRPGDQKIMMAFENERFPPQIAVRKEAPLLQEDARKGAVNLMNQHYYQGPHHLSNIIEKQITLVKGDNSHIDDDQISFGIQSNRQSMRSIRQGGEESKQNSRYILDPSEIQISQQQIAPPQKRDPLAECTDEDFLQLIKVGAEDVSTWEKVCSGDNVSVFKKMTEGSPVVLLKAFALIKNISPEVVYEVMSNVEIRRQWDKVVSNFEIIEDLPNEDRSVVYYMIKTPIGISNRDFLQQRKVKRDFPAENMITMHFKSVKHPKCPEKPRIIRADTIISGYIFEKIFNQDGTIDTTITIISQNDIKGLVPKAIVNMVAGKAPKQWVQNLVKGCTDYLNGVFKK